MLKPLGVGRQALCNSLVKSVREMPGLSVLTVTRNPYCSYKFSQFLFMLLIRLIFFCLEPAFICFSLKMAFSASSNTYSFLAHVYHTLNDPVPPQPKTTPFPHMHIFSKPDIWPERPESAPNRAYENVHGLNFFTPILQVHHLRQVLFQAAPRAEARICAR